MQVLGILFFILLLIVAAGAAYIGFRYDKKALKIGGVAGVVLMIFVGCALIGNQQKKEVDRLEKLVAELKEEIYPLEFKIIKKKNSEIKVEVKFLDLEGKTVGKKQTYTLSGDEIHFDFNIIKLNPNNYLFFPTLLYADTIAKTDAIKFKSEYSEDGFPAIYNKYEKFVKDSDKVNLSVYKEKLINLFTLVRNENEELIEEQNFGSAVHDLKNLKEFQVKTSYTVICHPHSGSLEVVELKDKNKKDKDKFAYTSYDEKDSK